MMHSLSQTELAAYEAEGFLEPRPLLSTTELAQIKRDFAHAWRRLPWYKGLHVWQGAWLSAAVRPEALDPVRSVLGDDVLLWGAILMVKRPGEPHRWHSDIETQEFRTVNAWIGVENVGASSPLFFIPGSQHFGVTPQELEARDGLDLLSRSAILGAARKISPNATLKEILVPEGAVVFFDGGVWHGTENRGSSTRKAILAQYCEPRATVRIPRSYASPATWSDQRPPCVVVSGDASGTPNLVVEPAPLIRTRGRPLAHWLHENLGSLKHRFRR